MARTLIRFSMRLAPVLTLMACAGSGPPPETGVLESVVFALAETHGAFTPDGPWFAFDVGERRYELRRDGGIRAQGGQQAAWQSTLPLSDGHFVVERVFHGVDGSHILLVLGLTDGEGAWGVIQRWIEGEEEPVWSAEFPAFNLGEPFAVGRKVYVTGIGTVAKLDLETGDFDWLHRNLYAAGDFNAFHKPYRSDNTMVFVGWNHLRDDDDTTFVLVNDTTGSILRIVR